MQPIRHKGRGFSLIELLIVIAIIGVLLAITIPAIQHSRETSRRTTCANQLRQIGVACQSFHATNGRFPAVSTTGVWGPAPGSIDPPPAGLSWIARLLAYLDERPLDAAILAGTRNQRPAFSAEVTLSGKPYDKARTDNPHVSQLALSAVICPAYSGSLISTEGAGSDSDYDKFTNRQASPAVGIAVSNYVAMSATHVQCMVGNPDESAETANGCIIPGPGISDKNITDGKSKTILVTETREQDFSSWYDGTLPWVVALNSNTPLPIRDAKRRWMAAEGAVTALNYGPTPQAPQQAYLIEGHGAAKGRWNWGPSSEHAGGIVEHLFVDGSVHPLRDDIDASVYLHLVTRAGADDDPISLE